jgi:hypothetical protein
VISHELDRYPFPIAYSARQLRIASNPADKVDYAQHCVELTAATLGVLALGWCQAKAVSPGGVQGWERKLDPGGVTLGTWIDMIQSTVKAMKDDPNDPLARAIRLAATGALPALRNYNPIRNVYAHGGKPRLRADHESAMNQLGPGVTAILDGVEPLTRIRLGRIINCRARGSSYLADLDELAGPTEPFRSLALRCTAFFDEGSVIAFHAGSLEFAVDLTPYCMWRACPECGRQELFYLHQRRKGSNYYFSFSTGHTLVTKRGSARPTAKPAEALGTTPLGSARAFAAAGWRANWADLASRPRRIIARLIDLTLALAGAAAGYALARTAGASMLLAALAVAAPLALLYEPLTALTGGTPGKRLLRIGPISAWNNRGLGRPDTLRRALAASAQLLLPPLALYNLAWLMWDPARQCLHDRAADSIVIAGRPRRSHGH